MRAVESVCRSWPVFLAHLHGDFDGRWVALGDHAIVVDVADGYAFERDRGAILESGGILKVGSAARALRRTGRRGAGHEKNEPDEHRHGHQDQRSHLQLRPLNLFAAWHVDSSCS